MYVRHHSLPHVPQGLQNLDMSLNVHLTSRIQAKKGRYVNEYSVLPNFYPHERVRFCVHFQLMVTALYFCEPTAILLRQVLW